MRVMISALPGAGHLFPTVPLAWALRSGGHEVLVAMAAEGVELAARAGFPVVDTAPGVDFRAIFARHWGGPPAGRAQSLAVRGREVAAAGAHTPERVFEMFADVSSPMADQMLRVARHWRPEVVIYSRLQAAGLLVASALDIPAIEHGVGFVREAGFAQRFVSFLGPIYERNGIPLDPPRVVSIHLAPAEMMVGDGDGWPMRYVPYNAGGVLPPWLTVPAGRPRVVVTLGTVVPGSLGVGGLAPVLAAAAEVDVEFILALGEGADLDALGSLPPNVRPVGWVPLAALLAGAAGVVHHGGAGSALTALAAGVPQLVLPHAFDQFVNAQAVARYGCGLLREPATVDAEVLGDLVGSRPLRASARAAAHRLAGMPTPASLVPRIEALAATAAAAPVSATVADSPAW
jgi:UDP:flavonoid glycosyltransferase YjiC (YdhE family)